MPKFFATVTSERKLVMTLRKDVIRWDKQFEKNKKISFRDKIIAARSCLKIKFRNKTKY